MNFPGRKSIGSTENPKSIAAMWAFSLVWCAFSGGMFYVWAFQAGDIFGSAITGFFLLIGLAVTFGAARKTLDYAKFGAVRLTLEGEPPAIGKRLHALIELPVNLAATGHISADLVCSRVTYSRGSKGGTSSNREDVWSGKGRFPVHRPGTGAAAAVHIDIPASLFPSDVPGEHGASSAVELGRDYHKWELRIAAHVRGLDLARTFDVPVLPAKRDAAAAARVPDDRVRRPAARSVTRVNPVTVIGRGSDAAIPAHTRRKRALAMAGLVTVLVAFAIGFLKFGRLDPPAENVAASNDPSSLRHPRAAGAPDLEAGPEATEFVATQASDALTRLREAVIAQAAINPSADAARLFQETLAIVERDHGGTSPLAALVHHRMSVMYLRRQRHVEQEQALLRALAILEQYSAAEVKSVPGMQDHPLDIEMIAADLGYAYWEQRRYDQAFVWYQRAYDEATHLDVSELSRNSRRAVSSAGLMASACTQGKWDIADRAMAELKQRMVKVDPELRKWLDYWVRTGEPRLAARKC